MAILQAHISNILFYIFLNAIASHSGTYTTTTYTQLTDKHAKIVLKLTTKVTEGHRLQSLRLNIPCPLFIHETLSWWSHQMLSSYWTTFCIRKITLLCSFCLRSSGLKPMQRRLNIRLCFFQHNFSLSLLKHVQCDLQFSVTCTSKEISPEKFTNRQISRQPATLISWVGNIKYPVP